MSFANIKGQDNAVKFLKGSLENSRIAHAYIFLGPGGVGKRLAAYNFAKALNCKEPVSGVSCDACAQCVKIGKMAHPDVFLITPEEEGRAIKIDMIRAVIKDIGLKPYEARKKVYIVDGADLMTQEASNAILKTLEEPPSDSVMILLASNLASLSRTIISRSQVVRFFPLGVEEVKDILAKEHSVDEARARILSHLSSGRLGEALKKSLDAKFFEGRDRLISGLIERRLYEANPEKITREELRARLDIMLTWYRDILVRKAGSGPAMLINADKEAAINDEADKMDFGCIEKVITQIIETDIYLEQNANPKLAMGVLGLVL